MDSAIVGLAPQLVALAVLALAGLSFAQLTAPSPAPLPPTNDVKAIDQGIAYVLLAMALLLTYLLH